MLLSEKLHKSEFSINKKISLIKIIESTCPRTDSCGIPQGTLPQSQYEEPIFVKKYGGYFDLSL